MSRSESNIHREGNYLMGTMEEESMKMKPRKQLSIEMQPIHEVGNRLNKLSSSPHYKQKFKE